ncbi:MAG: MgtC/SapB family protein [Brevundimonas sp.]|nr:MgtC/SapB family protein [Brevundimonas sp.]
MEFTDLPDFAMPLVAAVVAGGLIGFEREWRGRAAGFRTHILVCLASCLLMEAAVSQGAWQFDVLPGTRIVSDPTRMAHGVLTGIGFLCAGVIFRAGFSIHGLTTAASLWITATIGLLFGAGLFWLATTGAVLTVVILAALRIVSVRLPQQTIVDAQVSWRRDTPGAEDAVEAAMSDVGWIPSGERHELVDGGAAVQRSFRLRGMEETSLKALSARLRAVEGVTGYRLDPRDD